MDAGALHSISALGRITGIVTIGLPNGTLAFDMPVRVAFEGRAGDRAAFAGQGGGATLIGETCAPGGLAQIKEQLAGQGGGQCARDAGDDLEVWTDHFSSMASISSPRICR